MSHERSCERSDCDARGVGRTIEGVIKEVDEEDGGGGELQLGEGEVAHFGVRHLEFAFWRRLVYTHDEAR